ncbi:MAG: hypothetical protein OSB83_06530 [Planctomycetota bacterium]|nr:hypothetical protein [Planctomycetota bacterium]
MKIRALNLALALLLAGSVFSPAIFAVSQADGDKDKGVVKKLGVASVEKRSKLLQDRWKGLRSGPIERRILLIQEFANAPCKETVDFLIKLYGSEKNSGIHMSITQTLGKIGTEPAIRAVIGKGLPLLENNAFNITAVAQALENPIEAKAEQWLLKAGLRAASLRRNAVIWNRVVAAVADFKNPQRVAFLTREMMTSKSPETLVAILNSLENVKDKKVVSIAGKLVKHKDPGVQVAAMSLLYNQGGSREKKLFERGLKNRAWQVRLLSLRTLARLKHKKISDYAIAALDDPDDKVQVNAVRILLDQGGREIILPLIRHIDKAGGRVKDDIIDALTRLTGKDLGPSTFQWEGWWEQKGKTVKVVARCSAEEFTRMKQKLAEETNTVAYHGLRVLSDNFIFIFDSSESMKEQYVPPEERPENRGKAGGGDAGTTVVVDPNNPNGPNGGRGQKEALQSKLVVAQKNLKKVLNGLKNGKRFDIILFESIITDFIRAKLEKEPDKLAVLDLDSRVKALAFVDQARPQGQTYMLKALETAFENEEVDTIYLLSDGAPTPPERAGMKVILERMRKLNRVRSVKINTIGFDLKDKEKEFLRTLADEHFGVFIER